MKRWKKYAFLVMMAVSVVVYRTGTLIIMAREVSNREVETPKDSLMGKGGLGRIVAAAWGVDDVLKGLPDNRSDSKSNKDAQGTENRTEEPGKEPESETGGNRPSSGKGIFHRVEMDYLSDALFIGDSRTSTLYEYAHWDETDFFVKNGLTIWDVWEKTMNGRTLADMLSAKQYGKIYIMLGINELGNETAEGYRKVYEDVLGKIRELQPKAVIFVQSIMHVTDGKDAEGTYINNTEVNARNLELEKLADNQTVFYLDVNEAMDEPGTGKLNREYSNDGVHLKVKYIPVWREFLLEHGV